MKTIAARLTTLCALVAGLGLTTSAHAYWGLDIATPTNAVTGTAAGEGTVSMSGFYVANNTTTGMVNSASWTAGTLADYASYGIGMSSDGTAVPNHALDNQGNTEAVLLSFSNATALTSIGLGYTSNGVCSTTGTGTSTGCPTGQKLVQNGTTQVDLSLFRWVGGAGGPSGSSALTSTNASTMTGWELVGNYGDMVNDTSNPYNSVNGSGKTSSWWLISAYNSGFTQSAGAENRPALTDGDDYFKLFAVAGTTCATNLVNGSCGGSGGGSHVPEPATLALTSVALLGVAGLRRRRQQLDA